MNKQIWVKVTFCALVIIAITGVLEKNSLSYIKDISEKNLGFLGLVLEIKLILSGITDFVPFLKEHNGTLSESLEKAEHYLLVVNVVSLVQLMLLELSKAWLLKVVLAVLFLATFFKPSKNLSTKFLILFLAISPGLQIFSVTMHQLSKTSSIDYGQQYLTELKSSVKKMQTEKAQIMQEHEKKMTEIDNGKKGIRLFKKLKEDISYDLKKAKTTIKGDFSEIRILVRDGGKEIIRKLFIFCTMVLFTLLIVPIGYVIMVYIIYKSVITVEFKAQVKSIEDKVEHELIEKPKAKIQKEIQKPKDLIKKASAKVRGVEESVKDEVVKVEEEIEEKKDSVKSEINETENKVEKKKESIETKVDNEEASIESKVKKTENDVDDLEKNL
ncbi:MAG: hypothetical protein ABJ387_10125 [Balneola sp.]